MIGVPRARALATKWSGISASTASRLIAREDGPTKYRLQSTYEVDPLHELIQAEHLETVLSTYRGGLFRQSPQHLPHASLDTWDGTPAQFDPWKMWSLISRARGIAALATGWERPVYSPATPPVFPSWIDRCAGNADSTRMQYPLSAWLAARLTIMDLDQSIRSNTPSEWWECGDAARWLTSFRGVCRREGMKTSPDLRALVAHHLVDPAPVPDPELVFDVLTTTVRHAADLRLRIAVDPEVDKDLEYWLVGDHLIGVMIVRNRRVLASVVTVGNRDAGPFSIRFRPPSTLPLDSQKVIELEVVGSTTPLRLPIIHRPTS